ncbi:MAG: TonB family protein [Prevotella sp.]|nr:TonB family protein [Prevotella sp.]
MTPSSKKLIVRCPGCESLNADFGMAVESAVTYHLKLSGYSTATGSSKNQPVTFKITPADAVLTIDQNEYSTQSGVAQVMLSPGEHTYAVFAPGYNVQGSKFMVYENNNNKIIVELEAKTQTAGNLEVLPVVEETKVFDVVEQMPRFPGDNGNGAVLNGWLSKNLIYPPIAEKNGIKGRVICQFVIERDGSITDLEIVRSVDPSLDQEAVRVIKAMPKWIPGKQNGSSVRVKFTLPIIFTLHN